MTWKSDLVPELAAATQGDALQILASSDMSEIEIAERILEIRGVQKVIDEAIKKAQSARRGMK